MDYKLQILRVKSHFEEMESADETGIHVVDDIGDPEIREVDAQQRRIQAFSVGLEGAGDRKTIGTVIYKSIYTVILSKKFNLLIPFGPLAIFVQKKTNQNGWVFILGLLGIMPLAERLGYTTEQLAFYSGPTIGGLLNATFGNATELIISIYALRTGRIRVVQLSLLGSLLSNLLFVLGIAFFSGGIVRKEQVFNKATAVVDSGLLLMAVMGLLFPASLHSTGTEVHLGVSELALSRVSKAPPEISKWESVIWLGITAAAISILSEYLVDAIEGTSLAWGVPVAFISVILLPIGGNTAAVTTSVMFAMKDKLDVSLGVAIGSSTQISMFIWLQAILYMKTLPPDTSLLLSKQQELKQWYYSRILKPRNTGRQK
ncbi:hypothetical protein GOBAR_AA17701 [Gossypium barbadense]|uniref:Sodium/calcium exchanger membrane region domain-containing protein n=1 Tax=Gossypium barbadense TaxID=3634 RepID=A0A2P5XHZ9_GOSBA|nr:hypothetical protein GOBAR_AA17701 [Gossypium barbadense]